jgi:hypothetical protein
MQTHELPVRADRRSAPLRVIACSICLRVLHESGWVDADEAIRKLRTFALPAPVGLDPGLCDRCVDVVAARRTETAQPIDAAV